VLARCVFTGARATLLRALARSTLCVPDLRPAAGLSEARAGGVRVPCLADSEGRHALVYTSGRQLTQAHHLSAGATWLEVPVEALFGKWPADVDVWLNAGAELGFPLDFGDVGTVADIAAGLKVEEAYAIGPDDKFTDFPGPSGPDQVDCAAVLALLDVPEVLEVLRLFRRLEEPHGRTWRMLLVLMEAGVSGGLDAGAGHAGRRAGQVAQSVADAVNEASDECCEVHIADVHDNEVYDAVAHLLRIGVPLWQRQGILSPETIEPLDGSGGSLPPDAAASD
jgi:SseB protein N-terminal domain